MNLVSICLKISAWLYIVIGSLLTFIGFTYALVPMLGIAILVVLNAKSIDAESSRAAWIGVILMTLYTFSAFFPIGLAGLYGAYRDRKIWTRWE